MNFLEALKSGKRFRPKGLDRCKNWLDRPSYITLQSQHYAEPLSPLSIIGEWEVEQEPCKHEPYWDRPVGLKEALEKSFEEPPTIKCIHCGIKIKPTKWDGAE